MNSSGCGEQDNQCLEKELCRDRIRGYAKGLRESVPSQLAHNRCKRESERVAEKDRVG